MSTESVRNERRSIEEPLWWKIWRCREWHLAEEERNDSEVDFKDSHRELPVAELDLDE